MTPHTVCPRCGHEDSFAPGPLVGTCVCGVCQSQLDWRRIPGCGPDCRPAVTGEDETAGASGPPASGVPPIEAAPGEATASEGAPSPPAAEAGTGTVGSPDRPTPGV